MSGPPLGFPPEVARSLVRDGLAEFFSDPGLIVTQFEDDGEGVVRGTLSFIFEDSELNFVWRAGFDPVLRRIDSEGHLEPDPNCPECGGDGGVETLTCTKPASMCCGGCFRTVPCGSCHENCPRCKKDAEADADAAIAEAEALREARDYYDY